MSTHVLVTGACGYIGRHVVAELLKQGTSVIAVDRSVAEGRDASCKYISADILDCGFSVDSLYEDAPDVCLHLAWRDGFNHNAPSHMQDLSAHYRFIDKVAESGVPQIAVMGSMHEVGYWEGAITADTPCNPLSLYGIAKDALRRALLVRSRQAGFELQWLRGFYIYGDDEHSQSIFGKLIRAAREGQKTFPFTSGKNLYDFMPVDQLAEMIAKVVLQREVTGIINCCTGRPVSLAEEIEGFIEAHQLSIALEYGAYPDRPYDSPGVWGDPTLINRILSASER